MPLQNELPNKLPNKLKELYPDLTGTTCEILAYIIENPYATAAGIGNSTGISDRTARKHIALLRTRGIIRRHGSNKTGYWELTEDI